MKNVQLFGQIKKEQWFNLGAEKGNNGKASRLNVARFANKTQGAETPPLQHKKGIDDEKNKRKFN